MFKQLTIVPETSVTRKLQITFGFATLRDFCLGVTISGPGALLSAGFDCYGGRRDFHKCRSEIVRTA